MPRILIVEDDPTVVGLVERFLAREHSYASKSVRTSQEALPTAIAYKPDLILLDINLHGGDGRQVLKSLRANAATRAIPVIFLTGLGSEGDKVLGLNLGADDYIAKPFGLMELLARVEAVLRRTRPVRPGQETLTVADLTLDPAGRAASLKGKPLKLQPKEFEILYLLAFHRGRTLSRSYLIENTSSYGMEVATRSLDTHIKNLRRKLGSRSHLIDTVFKLGYRFAP